MLEDLNYLKSKDEVLATILHGDVEFVLSDNDIESDDILMQKKVYEALLSSIISQQVSTAAARSIKNKFISLYGGVWPTYEELLESKVEDIRSAGLSGQKAGYVKNVAEYFSQQKSMKYAMMSDEQIIQKLTEIKGVGRWTVEMLLMFTLGRQDIFSIKDGGLINGVMKLYGLEKYHPKSGDTLSLTQKEFEKKIVEITEKWSPYRTLASMYIWKYKDTKVKFPFELQLC